MKTKVLTAFLFLIVTSTHVLAAPPFMTSLQQQINQLNARVNDLEAQQPTPVAKLYAGDVLLGYRSLTKGVEGENIFLYEPISGYFLTLTVTTDGGTSTYFLSTSDIAYETFDCTGTGLVPTVDGESDTRNVLIGNGSDFYKTTGTYIPRPPLNKFS